MEFVQVAKEECGKALEFEISFLNVSYLHLLKYYYVTPRPIRSNVFLYFFRELFTNYTFIFFQLFSFERWTKLQIRDLAAICNTKMYELEISFKF